MPAPALFGAKKVGFFANYGVSAQSRGVEPVRTRRMGPIFRDYERTSFMDGP